MRAVFQEALLWRHNGHDGVSNHQPHECLLNRLFRRKSKKTSKLRVTGLCVGNSPGTGEFPAQMASNAENVSIWWRHHIFMILISTMGVEIRLLTHWGRVTHVCVSEPGHYWIKKTACCLFSAKLLSKSMLTYCQFDPKERNSTKPYLKF